MGVMVRDMRDGDIFENKIRKGSHSETVDGKHGRVEPPQTAIDSIFPVISGILNL
jgi:hypothetical protein